MGRDFEGFSFSHALEVKSDVPDGAVKLSQGTFDSMKLMRAGNDQCGTTTGAGQFGEKVCDYGSISLMQLPAGYKPVTPFVDTGLVDPKNSPRIFESAQADSRIGLHHERLSPQFSAANAKEVLGKPPHCLTDDEYFKIADMMTPGGPWSANGRGHELGLRTEVINGKKAVVYDFWRAADMSKDGFDAKLGPNDIRTRVVFVPNDTTHKVDVFWFEAKNSDFDKQAKEFDQSLKSIRWK